MTGNSHTIRLASTLSTLALVAGMTWSAPAMAEAPENTSGDIVVTARKTGEDILKVPVTVTAITSETLEAKGIVSMVDVANSTPGININNSSSGHADRSFQQVVLRGFTPSTTLATTVSTFIDGVPVSSPSQVGAISNPERIEILKGPQSAYFGRNTFAGAINVVNKVPGNDWGGQILGMVGTRDNWRLQGSVEGPIIEDLISFRVTGEKWSKSGSWKNYDGSTLGDQSSTVGTAMLAITPSSSVTIKLFGMMGEDKDGPAAQTRLSAYTVTAPNGSVVLQGQSNCTLTGDTRGVLDPTTGQPIGTAVSNPYFCGTIPTIANPVTANVENTDQVRQFLASTRGRVVSPDDTVSGYGLLRKTRHVHGTIDVDLTDNLTASALAGYNREVWTTLIDLDGYDTRAFSNDSYDPPANYGKGYFDYPYLIERKIEDFSLEGRLSYTKGPFRGVAGVSYLSADQIQGNGGSTGSLLTASMFPGGLSRNKTTGFFFGLTYDLTDTISASVEGRYQIDKLQAFATASGLTVASSAFIPAGFYEGGSLLASATYKNFTPRAIINWQISPDMMVYASWSKGVNPAQFNTSILSNAATVQQAALDAGGQLSIKPEKITNYELGLKGKALGGNLRYSLAAYYAQWRDQINAVTIVAPDSTQATGFSFVNTSANSGDVDLYGVEGEVSWRPTDFITIDAAGAVNETDIQKFTSTTISALTGIYDFSGKEMKNTSKYSANVGVTLGTEIAGWDEGRWFVRGDWNFKSGQWSNEANLAKTPDLHLFNVRAGITHGQITVEAFVNNLFNNHTPISVSDNFVFNPTFSYTARYSALMLGLPELRTAGIQTKITF
ncbi:MULTISPECIES: TonB-dependent receptor [unclassified Novosphingobium]|uniref:TonB-dependent receptor n=1 Tax=unclassified Novosphingobium TaxID=2644732 RepID=UPI00104882A6|nr:MULTISPECIES: TonB-dependent receptor [unclassified Novosphingobium]MPS68474.1 TonB-dependent receptor [Novosphingobium sp.]TCM41356.1 iron complex outermembrane receptor protein [Novosphingobium sp. ST904]WRT95488.1 TonB-dependent receptor [Novosphingobium sp. RL4]